MITILNRFAWLISISLGICISFLFLRVGYFFYSSGWFIMLILSFLIKRLFLSESFLKSNLDISNKGFIIRDEDISHEFDRETDTIQKENVSMEEYVNPVYNEIEEDEVLNTNKDEYREESGDYLSSRRVDPYVQQHIENKSDDYDSLDQKNEPSWVVSFFSDRPLAKIGGILLFLGVIYFFSLIWGNIGHVGKVLIGFIFGFSFYGIGVWMDTKGNTSESHTLLGVGIAVNAFTILSGRWLLGDANPIFSDMLTLIFLLLNTILSVITGLIYGSRTFLVFSFAFGYVIPFISGGSVDTPYTLLGYNAVITGAGYILASRLSYLGEFHKENASWLMNVLILGSFLLGLSNIGQIQSSGDLGGYMIITLLILGFGMYIDMKNFASKYLVALMISGYMIILFLLFGKAFEGTISIFIISIIPLFCFSLFQIITIGFTIALSWLLFIPLLFGIFLTFIFGFSAFLFVIPSMLVLYVIAIIILSDKIPQIVQLLLFVGLAVFLFSCGVSIHFSTLPIESEIDRLILSSASILFFVFSTGFSLSRKVQNLSLISTISTLFILSLVLSPGWNLSWIVFIIFILCAAVAPFLSKEKIPGIHSIIHIALLALFTVLEIAFLGQDLWFLSVPNTSSGLITLGFIYLIFSIVATFYALALIRISTGVPLFEIEKLSDESKNMTYGLLAVPVSLFSLSIAVIFSNNPGVVACVWILESTILTFLYRKNRNDFILLGSIVLIVIGLLKLIPFFDTIHSQDWLSLVPVSIIMISLCGSVRFISPRNSNLQIFFDVLHIVGMISVLTAFIQIIPVTIYGFSILGVGILITLLSRVYRKIDSDLIAAWLLFLIGSAILSHIFKIEVDNLSTSIFPLIIQLAGMLLTMYAAWTFLRWHRYGIISFIITSVGAIIITSIYVNIITGNVFAVTIYLTAVATFFIIRGIHLDRPYYRTIGLYIGLFVLAKIFIYDLRAGFDNVAVRVLALMITGGVMIAISQLYGRSVKRAWSEEFSSSNFSGLFSSESSSFGAFDSHNSSPEQDMPFSDEIAKHLKELDISQISMIRFIGTDGKTFISKRAGIIRVSLYIVQQMKMTHFDSNELSYVFEQVLPHLKSNLPKNDLDALLGNISDWIRVGGSVEIVNKK